MGVSGFILMLVCVMLMVFYLVSAVLVLVCRLGGLTLEATKRRTKALLYFDFQLSLQINQSRVLSLNVSVLK